MTRAATALGIGLLLLGAAQLATSIGLRRRQRWSYATAVIGGLFVAITAGATAVFMVVTIPTQSQAAVPLLIGSLVFGFGRSPLCRNRRLDRLRPADAGVGHRLSQSPLPRRRGGLGILRPRRRGARGVVA